MQWGLQIHSSGIYKVIQCMQIGKLCLTEGEILFRNVMVLDLNASLHTDSICGFTIPHVNFKKQMLSLSAYSEQGGNI